MRFKLPLIIAGAVGLAASGGALGAHYVIKGGIEQAMARLEARSPGLNIEYGGYEIDPFGRQLTLDDVVLHYKPATAGAEMVYRADKLTYRNCDFDHDVPRYCDAGFQGLTLQSEEPVIAQGLARFEELMGEPLKLDGSFVQTYDPDHNHFSDTRGTIRYGTSAKLDLAVKVSGVDFAKAVKDASAMQAQLAAAKTPEEQQVAMAALASAYAGLQLHLVDLKLEGQTLLGRFRDQIPLTEEQVAGLPEVVRGFLAQPREVAVRMEPKEPINLLSVGFLAAGGLQALQTLNLSVKLNGEAVAVPAP